MKKILTVILALALFGIGYILISKRPSKPVAPQPATSREQPEQTAPAEADNLPFDADDRLDEALAELEQLEQF